MTTQAFKMSFIAMLLLAVNALHAIASEKIQGMPALLTDDDFRPFNAKAAELGQLLFYDPILSGNRNISCGTCHHHKLATVDHVSLGIGEGGHGLGLERKAGEGQDAMLHRVPRNAPALFNMGARELDIMFHDGRVSVDPKAPSGFDSPAEEILPKGLVSITAAQAMFPVTAAVEMAGHIEENEIAGATQWRQDRVWHIVAARVRAIDDYTPLFMAAYPDKISQTADITMVDIANAIGDFIDSEWRADRSRFDLWQQGLVQFTAEEKRGVELFYGEAGCADCHSGPFFSDHDFHAIAIPQFGPGRTRQFANSNQDLGRLNETSKLADAYKFRTPMLRNIVETHPYGHNGAYRSLEAMVRHHYDPVEAYKAWRPDMAVLPDDAKAAETDFLIMQNQRDVDALLAANELAPKPYEEEDIQALLAFLGTLTDEYSLKGRLGVPATVPSGLPVDR